MNFETFAIYIIFNFSLKIGMSYLTWYVLPVS